MEKSLDINSLMKRDIKYKKSTPKIQARQRRSLDFLVNYLKGNGKHEAKKKEKRSILKK